MANSFVYKYKPKSLSSPYINPSISAYCKHCLDVNQFCVLFYGEHGVGKTTLLQLIVNEYYGGKGGSSQVLHVNILLEQGVNYCKTEINAFCQTKSTIKKMIVMDDFDLVSPQVQQVFRSLIDKYGNKVHFVASCSNTQNIVPQILSRMCNIIIPPMSQNQMFEYVKNIVVSEKVNVTDEMIWYIIQTSNYNIGISVYTIEKCKLLGYCDETICSTISYTTFEQYICEKDVSKAVQIILALTKKGYSILDILDAFLSFIKWTPSLPDDIKYEMIPLIGKHIILFHTSYDTELELAIFTKYVVKIINE